MVSYIHEKTIQPFSLADPLSCLGLSASTQSILTKEHIITLQDLLNTGKQGLNTIPDLGQKEHNELLNFMSHLRFYLPGHIHSPLTGIPANSKGSSSARGNVSTRSSITVLANTIEDDRLRDMLIQRLKGVPLKAIASQHHISKERVRQIVLTGLQKLELHPVEDKYIPVFEKYLFTKSEFMQTFAETSETYHYLTIMCNKTQRPHFSKFTADASVSPELARCILAQLSRGCICIDGERVERSRIALTKHVARTRFQDSFSFEDLVIAYRHVLTQYGLDNDPSLAMNARSYMNHLRHVDFVLWQPDHILRYYEINSRNYDELLNTLRLDQYRDVEYSARKFFLAEPQLMKKYDIRNEYELHNLLRRIYETHPLEQVRFLRTPNISFGNSDRSRQVREVLLQHSPITANEFMVKYAEIYGIDPETTNSVFYLKPFREYQHNGVYDLRTKKEEKTP